MIAILAVSLACLGGCGTEKESGKQGQDKMQERKEDSGSTEKAESTAVSLLRSSNPNTVSLNAERVFDSEKSSSWVKIATIWDTRWFLILAR